MPKQSPPSAIASYSKNKNERLEAIRSLANHLDSAPAAETLSAIASYSNDADLRTAAIRALGPLCQYG